jgi:hypothetical protein
LIAFKTRLSPTCDAILLLVEPAHEKRFTQNVSVYCLHECRASVSSLCVSSLLRRRLRDIDNSGDTPIWPTNFAGMTPPSSKAVVVIIKLTANENIDVLAADNRRHEPLTVDAKLSKALRKNNEIEFHSIKQVENKARVICGQESRMECHAEGRRLFGVHVGQPAQPAFLPFAVNYSRLCFASPGINSEDSDEIEGSEGSADALHCGLKGAVALQRSIVQSDDRRNMFKEEWRCTVATLFSVFDLGRNVAESLGK